MIENYKIYNGNCFDVMHQLVDRNVKVDAIICDPPYLINYADWDKEFDMPLAIDLSYELLKDNGNFILFQGWSNITKTKELLDQKFKTGLYGTGLKDVDLRKILYLLEKIFYGIAMVMSLHIQRYIQIFLRKPVDLERKMVKKTEH